MLNSCCMPWFRTPGYTHIASNCFTYQYSYLAHFMLEPKKFSAVQNQSGITLAVAKITSLVQSTCAVIIAIAAIHELMEIDSLFVECFL